MLIIIFLQVTSALADIRHHLSRTRRSQFFGNGLFDYHPVYDANFCDYVHRNVQVANEQSNFQ